MDILYYSFYLISVISEMPPPKNHSQMQKVVCAVCFRKPANMRNISDRVKITIKESILPDFGTGEWDWLPTSICSGCYKDIADFKQDPKRWVFISENKSLATIIATKP